MDEWSIDSKIDPTEPGKELLSISSLQAKYLRVLSSSNKKAGQLGKKHKKLKKIKWEYYLGDLNNPEDLKKYGYEPFLKKVLKADVGMYLDADDELNDILSEIQDLKEIAEYCTSVLKELHSRTFQIKAFIDWEKFTNGQ
jgi:hypothetical protein